MAAPEATSLPDRVRARLRMTPDRWLTLSLVVAFALTADTGAPPRAAVMQLFVIGILAVVSLRWPVGWLALLALFIGGIDLRLEYARTGSDVLTVTRAAIDVVLAGGNPYGIGYPQSTPPGAPFPYGPLALLWYMPPIRPQVIEFAAAIVVLMILALRGRPLGMAIYATAPALVITAGDGSNDTTLGLLLLVALALAERWPRTGAFVLGLAIAFKPTALAWAAPMVGYAGLTGLLALALGAGLFWLPALIAWGPQQILDSISRANRIHATPYYSLSYVLERFNVGIAAPVLDIARFGVAGLLSLIALVRVRSVGAVAAWGAAIFLVGLFFSFWSSFAYFAVLGPIVAWHIDGLAGNVASRVRWPGDPVGGLSAWLDKRWPRLESRAQRRTVPE